MIWVKNFIFGIAFLCLFQACSLFQDQEVVTENSITLQNLEEIEELPGYDSYGFVKNEATVKEARVKRNESLYVILRSLDVTPEDIYTIQEKSKGKFNTRRINQNQKYYTYHDPDTDIPLRMVFHQTATDYVVFDWSNGILFKLQKSSINCDGFKLFDTIKHAVFVKFSFVKFI